MVETKNPDLPSEEPKLHFDFWLDDFEGEMLFAFIQNEISRCLEKKLKLMSGRTPVLYPGATEEGLDAYLDWYDRHIEWLEQLKAKLKRRRVEEPVIGPTEGLRQEDIDKGVRREGDLVVWPDGGVIDHYSYLKHWAFWDAEDAINRAAWEAIYGKRED